MKTLNDIEIIITSEGVDYNYKGVLYTKEQFEERFFNQGNECRESLEYARGIIRAWQKGEHSGFYASLIVALSKADRINKERIARAFPTIVAAYDEYKNGGVNE